MQRSAGTATGPVAWVEALGTVAATDAADVVLLAERDTVAAETGAAIAAAHPADIERLWFLSRRYYLTGAIDLLATIHTTVACDVIRDDVVDADENQLQHLQKSSSSLPISSVVVPDEYNGTHLVDSYRHRNCIARTHKRWRSKWCSSLDRGCCRCRSRNARRRASSIAAPGALAVLVAGGTAE